MLGHHFPPRWNSYPLKNLLLVTPVKPQVSTHWVRLVTTAVPNRSPISLAHFGLFCSESLWPGRPFQLVLPAPPHLAFTSTWQKKRWRVSYRLLNTFITTAHTEIQRHKRTLGKQYAHAHLRSHLLPDNTAFRLSLRCTTGCPHSHRTYKGKT